jgi:tetratricopeptide (TPR) repeat protein
LERASLRLDTKEEHLLAIEDLNKVIERSTDLNELEPAHHQRAGSCEYVGDISGLLSDLEWLIQHGLGTANDYRWHGFYKEKVGAFQDALDDYTAAYQLEQNDGILLKRAVMYYYLKRYKESLQDLTKIIESNKKHHPSKETIYNWRGSVYYALGNEIEALNDFRQAITLSNEIFPSVTQYIQKRGLPYMCPKKLRKSQKK